MKTYLRKQSDGSYLSPDGEYRVRMRAPNIWKAWYVTSEKTGLGIAVCGSLRQAEVTIDYQRRSYFP